MACVERGGGERMKYPGGVRSRRGGVGVTALTSWQKVANFGLFGK